MSVNIGDRINIWITGDGPVKYRAVIASVLHSTKRGTIPAAVQVTAPDGRVAKSLLQLGQFIVINDQSKPEWEH